MNPLRRLFLKPYHFLKAILAVILYNYPAKSLTVIGVTGTDGKTTTSHLIYEILKRAGKKVALVSSVAAYADGQETDTGFHVTTPDPFSLQAFIKRIVGQKTEYLVLEVTSHGLDQFRLLGCGFKVAVITNVTNEHLDYHQTFEDYLKTKATILKGVDYAVLNYDDPSFEYLASRKKPSGHLTVFSQKPIPDSLKTYLKVFKESTTEAFPNLEFTLSINGEPLNLRSNLSGQYNLENIMAAVVVTKALQTEDTAIVTAVSNFKGVSGRLEQIEEGQSFKVVVDFAHTPNALEKVLTLYQELKNKNFHLLRQPADLVGQEKLIVVFGCAGLRDKSKRPLMGEIAGRLADVSILTAEDPRTENVNDIINDITIGCLRAGAKEYLESKLSALPHDHVFIKKPDRRQAIELALMIAKAGDIILVTGKGHEKSMCFGTTEYPWSDQVVVREELKKLPR